MECIVLAGGLGTRLRDTIGDHPKCMAPVNGLPFLHYLFIYLQQQGCTRVILSLGYQAQKVTDWLATQQLAFEVVHVIEQEPLGTGGGLQLALSVAENDDVAVLNGDTMFLVPLAELCSFHQSTKAAVTLALKEMQHFERYGVVQTNSTGLITGFEEKMPREHGFINGGVYIINKESFLSRQLRQRFSFEKDYLEAFIQEQQFYGTPCPGYFIDIGIPADYNQAQQDFKKIFA